jgi:hypothetical protein
MSEIDDALARLGRAVARLEAASSRAARTAKDSAAEDDQRVAAVAAGIAAKIDAALARLGQLLERED